MYDITDYGHMLAISQIIFGQYHIWDTVIGLGLKSNKPESAFSLHVRWRDLDIFKKNLRKYSIFFGLFFLEFFWNFLEEFFGGNFLGGMFWEKFIWGKFCEKFFCDEFFGRNFLGGIFWEEFFVYIVKVS